MPALEGGDDFLGILGPGKGLRGLAVLLQVSIYGDLEVADVIGLALSGSGRH